MPLTDAVVRQTGPAQSTVKLSDGGGLQLWIEPRGSKLWRLAYRFGGKQKKLAIGVYPTVTLAQAREQREQAKRLLAAGIDPGQQRKLDRLARANSEATTFAVVAAELLAKKRREGEANNTIGKREWLYGRAGESFGKRRSPRSARQRSWRCYARSKAKGSSIRLTGYEPPSASAFATPSRPPAPQMIQPTRYAVRCSRLSRSIAPLSSTRRNLARSFAPSKRSKDSRLQSRL